MFDAKDILGKINKEGYGVVAIRHLAEDENYTVGDMCRNSYDWNYEYDHSSYEDDDPIELDGTCGYHIVGLENLDENEIEEAKRLLEKAIEEASIYAGKAVVIAGNNYEYGNDEHEVIIADAGVIAII